MSCCRDSHITKSDDQDLNELRSRLIPETEYQERFKNENFLKQPCHRKKRFISAGVTTRCKPEYQPQEHRASDGIVPYFSGESTTRSAYKPQPPISRLPSSKPPPEMKAPMLLEPYSMEVDSHSHDVYCPMPQELVHQTAPTKPLWMMEKLKSLKYEPRHDLTSNYQADYCGVQTKPRKICLQEERNLQNKWMEKEFNISCKDKIPQQKYHNGTKDEILMWDYIHSLLFCTTNNNTYLPPSTFGQPPCHTTKYHPNDRIKNI